MATPEEPKDGKQLAKGDVRVDIDPDMSDQEIADTMNAIADAIDADTDDEQ